MATHLQMLDQMVTTYLRLKFHREPAPFDVVAFRAVLEHLHDAPDTVFQLLSELKQVEIVLLALRQWKTGEVALREWGSLLKEVTEHTAAVTCLRLLNAGIQRKDVIHAVVERKLDITAAGNRLAWQYTPRDGAEPIILSHKQRQTIVACLAAMQYGHDGKLNSTHKMEIAGKEVHFDLFKMKVHMTGSTAPDSCLECREPSPDNVDGYIADAVQLMATLDKLKVAVCRRVPLQKQPLDGKATDERSKRDELFLALAEYLWLVELNTAEDFRSLKRSTTLHDALKQLKHYTSTCQASAKRKHASPSQPQQQRPKSTAPTSSPAHKDSRYQTSVEDIRRREDAVCMIEVRHVDGPWTTGTGFLVLAPLGQGSSAVSQKCIMTNHHVIPNQRAAGSAKGFFSYDSEEGVRHEVKLEPSVFFRANADLDLAVCAFDDFPVRSKIAKLTPIPLSDIDPKPNEIVHVITHSKGSAKQSVSGLVQQGTLAHGSDPTMSTFWHTASTSGGSPGAPVLDNQMRQLVGVHKWGGFQANGATRVSKIREFLR